MVPMLHVGAQGCGRAGQGAFEDGDHAGAGDAGFDLQAHGSQLFSDQFSGAFFSVAKFWMSVKVAAGFQQLRFELLRLLGDARAGAVHRRGTGVAGDQGEQKGLGNARQLHGLLLDYCCWLPCL